MRFKTFVFATSALVAALTVDAQAEALRWNGWYAGAHLGGGGGLNRNSSPEGSAIYGDRGTASSILGGLQAGYNWQGSGGRWVAGVEASLSGVYSDSTNTCLMAHPAILSANCHVEHDALATLTGRLGYTLGDNQQTLLYVRGGAAWLRSQTTVMTNGDTPLEPTFDRGIHAGWIVGAGVEHALNARWSVTAGYDFASFGIGEMPTPIRVQQFAPGVPLYNAFPGTQISREHGLHLIRLGLNYRFGAPDDKSVAATAATSRASAAMQGWTAEVGARYWMSYGRFQKDLGITPFPAQSDRLISRLTYDSRGHSGELFGRLDSPEKIFVKGYAGGGGLPSGGMIDEDWLLSEGTPYSATLSDPVTGSLAYLSADLGYTFLQNGSNRLGGFVGYHFYRDKKKAMGCVQFGYPVGGPCVPSMPSSLLVISEDNDWHSLRVGAVADIMLTERLKLTAEAAYVPYTRFIGLDGHMQRTDVPTPWSQQYGYGQGVQLEALLSMEIMPRLSVGIGGRYWALWSTKNAFAEPFGALCPNCSTLPVRTERYGVFLQTSYAFGGSSGKTEARP